MFSFAAGNPTAAELLRHTPQVPTPKAASRLDVKIADRSLRSTEIAATKKHMRQIALATTARWSNHPIPGDSHSRQTCDAVAVSAEHGAPPKAHARHTLTPMKLNIPRMALCAALVLIAQPAAGSPAPSPERGKHLAVKLCSNCHLVEGSGDGPQSTAGPASFAVAANRPGQSPERLEGLMIEPPHPSMPEPPLSRDQIRDLAAYIMSLKKQ